MALNRHPLFVGLTRPIMIAGVSYEAAMVIFMATAVVFLASGNVFTLLVGLPLYGVAYLVCLKDPRAFRLMALWLSTKGRSITRDHWGASSHSPFSHSRKKWKESLK